jgi:hypothetical protein
MMWHIPTLRLAWNWSPGSGVTLKKGRLKFIWQFSTASYLLWKSLRLIAQVYIWLDHWIRDLPVTFISLPSSISALIFTSPTVYSLDSCGTEMPNGRIRVFRVLRLFEIFLICQPLVATFFNFFLDRAMSYVLEIKIQMTWVSELNLDHYI